MKFQAGQFFEFFYILNNLFQIFQIGEELSLFITRLIL